MIDQIRAADTVRRVLELLVAGDFEALEELASGRRLRAKEMRGSIEDYGHTPVMPDRPIEEILDIVEITDSAANRWSVNCPLFTAEEGQSDLTLSMTFQDTDAGPYTVEIDDIHVL